MYSYAAPPDAAIALEITISELLFRRLQELLDSDPTLSLDALASKALTAYLSLAPGRSHVIR